MAKYYKTYLAKGWRGIIIDLVILTILALVWIDGDIQKQWWQIMFLFIAICPFVFGLCSSIESVINKKRKSFNNKKNE